MKAEKKVELVAVNDALKLAMRDLQEALIATMQNTGSMRDVNTLRDIIDALRQVEKAIDHLSLVLEFL